MANEITGREIVFAVGKGATWRTAVDVDVANSGVLISNEGMGAKAPTFLPDDSLGQDDLKNMIETCEEMAGSVTGFARYENWDLLIALAMGTAGSPSQEEGSAYSNTYSIAANLEGLFATLAMKKSDTTHDIWEVPSATVGGFTFSGEICQLCNLTVNFQGNKIENLSPVNTDLSSVTYRTSSNILKMDSRTKFRMNTNAGAALQDSDKIYPFSFELVWNRPMTTNREAGYSDASEPTQDGFAEATIRLTFDKYNIDTFMDAIGNGTAQKMDILFEGDIISGTTRYTWRFDLPKIQWTSGAADVGGPGQIQHVVEGRCLAVDTAPTGMTGTDPFDLYVINTLSASPLA